MVNRIVCANCGHRNAAFRRSCQVCGAALAPPRDSDRQDNWQPAPPPLNTTEMVLIGAVVALLLACLMGYWMLTAESGSMAAVPWQNHPEMLLLLCPVALIGLLGSVITYRLWWRDPSRSYVLLSIMLLLVLAAGLTIGWLALTLFANA